MEMRDDRKGAKKGKRKEMKKKILIFSGCILALFLTGTIAIESVDRLVLDPKIISSWDGLLQKYLDFREVNGPLVPPSVSYSDVYARLKKGDWSFLAESENWQFKFTGGTYYVAEDSKFLKLKEPLHILIYEDIQRAEIVILTSRDGEKYKGAALFDAPDFFEPDGSISSLTSEEKHLYFFDELAPRRIVWQIMLKSEEDAWSDLVSQRDAVSMSLPEEGWMMAMMGGPPPEHTNDLWLGIGGTTITVYVPENFTNRVELYSTTDLVSNIWTVAVQGLLPVKTNPAVWVSSLSGPKNYIRAGNMDVDTDGDGLPDGRESIVHKTLPNDPDTDGDDAPDGWELQYGFNPLLYADGAGDFDSDDLSNADEYLNGTYPNDTDSEDDGMSDGWEVAGGLDPLTDDTTDDPDDDGVNNLAEYTGGTHPQIVNVTLPTGATGSLVFRYDDDGRLTESHLNNSSSELYSLTPAHNLTNLNVFATEE